MPRPLRLEFEGAWYHVMNRGAAHQDIFKNDQHRELFLNLLKEASLYYNIQCHAYCLMNNHYHLLIHTPQGNLSAAMRHINGLYTQKFNRLEKKDGPLFRGRYKAILVEENDYLLHVSRYIHLNPVEAKIISEPEAYRWSSYSSYIKYKVHPSWLHIDTILGMFGSNKRIQYKRFIDEGLDKFTRSFYEMKKQPAILGDANFKNQQLNNLPELKIKDSMPDYNRTRDLPSILDIAKTCSKYFNIKEETLFHYRLGKTNMPRKIAMYLSRVVGQARLNDIAEYFDCKSKSGASNAVSKIKSDLIFDNTLVCHLKNIEILLKNK